MATQKKILVVEAGAEELTPRRLEVGTRGSYGVTQIDFRFSPAWDNLVVRVCFYPKRGAPLSVPYIGEPIDIPYEIMRYDGESTFVLSGIALSDDAGEERQIETTRISLTGALSVLYTSSDKSGNEKKVTPDTYDLFLTEAKEHMDRVLSDATKDLRENAENSAQSAENSAESAKNHAEISKNSADNAGRYAESSQQSVLEARDAAIAAGLAANDSLNKANLAKEYAEEAERAALGAGLTVENGKQEIRDLVDSGLSDIRQESEKQKTQVRNEGEQQKESIRQSVSNFMGRAESAAASAEKAADDTAVIAQEAVESVQRAKEEAVTEVNNNKSSAVEAVQREGENQKQSIIVNVEDSLKKAERDANRAELAAGRAESSGLAAVKNISDEADRQIKRIEEAGEGERATLKEDATYYLDQTEGWANKAKEEAEKAEASVSNGAYIVVSVGEDGNLYMEKTENADEIDLFLDKNGNLYMEVNKL